MAKVKFRKIEENGRVLYMFYCPGCRRMHPFDERWQFNGDYERPTFTPSLMVNRDSANQCHSYVTDGNIQFLSDCKHELAGQTVEIPDWDEDKHW
jgi:hypothetical protein